MNIGRIEFGSYCGGQVMGGIDLSTEKNQRPVEENNCNEKEKYFLWKISIVDKPLFSTSTISSVHRPRGDSPQLCTVIKGQLLNPSAESSSTLRPSKVELVPSGEVKNICRFPAKSMFWKTIRAKGESTSIFHFDGHF